jgi:PAS domain S-box-containing protein
VDQKQRRRPVKRKQGISTRVYETILSTTDDFAYIFDPQGRFLYANARLLKVWAKTLDQVIGKTCYDLGYPTWHADMHMREIEEIVRTKKQIRGEVPFTGASGISGVYDYIFKPVLDLAGNVEVIVGTTRDITERKRGEEKLQAARVELQKRAEELETALRDKSESERRYRFLADSVPQIVWTAKPDGNLDYFNQRWFDYAHTNAEEMQKLGWTHFVHPDDLASATRVWQRSLETGCDYENEFRVMRALDHTYRWHLVRAFPMKNARGEIIQWVGTCIDMDDQRQLNQRLGEAAAKFRSLFDQSPVFAGIMTTDGVLLEANHSSLEGCGYEAGEVVGRPFWECGWWRGSQQVQQKIRAAVQGAAGGNSFTATLPYHLADGTERLVDLTIHPIRDAEGRIIFLNPTGVDVTERHRAHVQAEFLAQLTQKLSTVSNAMEINRIATAEIGRFLNAQLCCCFQVLDEAGRIRVLPDWRPENQPSVAGDYDLSMFGTPEWAESLRQGPMFIEDVRLHHSTRDFVASYAALNLVGYAVIPFVQEGKWVACMGVGSDRPRHWAEDEKALLENAVVRVWPLFERARIEEVLRENEQRFRAMSDNIAPLAWMAGADGKIFWYNKRWYEYTGETPETMRDDGWVKVHQPEHLDHVWASWRKSLAEGHPWEDTFPLRGADGQFRWFLSRAFPIRDADDKITLWFGTNTDITDLREAQDALHQANLQLGDRAAHLEAIVQQRTHRLSEIIGELEAFSYSISHDMRSPLRSMIGFAEILKEDYAGKLDAQGIDYLNRISTASRRMDRLIQDVLTYSRVSRNEIELQPVDADALVREVVRSYPNLHADKATISIRDRLPAVKANEALLTQCFSNLLENGAKFVAPETRAVIEVWAENAGGRSRIFFKDNGIGMPAHSLERIFEIFHRVGRDREGTGIGLAIVRKAVEKMGGRVGVESELGKGSVFWLDLETA